MKVLMKKDLRKVGKKGEIVDVSDGYGANYLIPNGYAVLYTVQAQKDYELELKKEAEERAKKREEAKVLAQKLETITLVYEASAGRNGDMIGTVSFKKISDTLKKQYDIKIEKSQIIPEDKNILVNGFGPTNIRVDLFDGVIGTIHVKVVLKAKK